MAPSVSGLVCSLGPQLAPTLVITWRSYHCSTFLPSSSGLFVFPLLNSSEV